MTTAEALAVVREALTTQIRLAPADCTGDCDFGPCNCSGKWRYAPGIDAALAALALIEERLKEESEQKWSARKRAQEAEDRVEELAAEADALEARATENWDSYENANRRIEELEAALREITTWPTKVFSGNVTAYVPNNILEIARRALGGVGSNG